MVDLHLFEEPLADDLDRVIEDRNNFFLCHGQVRVNSVVSLGILRRLGVSFVHEIILYLNWNELRVDLRLCLLLTILSFCWGIRDLARRLG